MARAARFSKKSHPAPMAAPTTVKIGMPNNTSARITSFRETSSESNWTAEMSMMAIAPKKPITAPIRVNPESLIYRLELSLQIDRKTGPPVRPGAQRGLNASTSSSPLYTPHTGPRRPRATLRAAAWDHVRRTFDVRLATSAGWAVISRPICAQITPGTQKEQGTA